MQPYSTVPELSGISTMSSVDNEHIESTNCNIAQVRGEVFKAMVLRTTLTCTAYLTPSPNWSWVLIEPVAFACVARYRLLDDTRDRV